MSCHLCQKELEFSEIAGFNPNCLENDSNRTNFCWVDEAHTRAAAICDDCYYNNEEDIDQDENFEEEEQEEGEEGEEGEEEDYDYDAIYCIACGTKIEDLDLVNMTDDEFAEASTTFKCTECALMEETPVTPELNESPSDEEEEQPPSPQPSFQP
jgi:hypothetical protein